MGIYGNVVFTCGAVVSHPADTSIVSIYYGAADQHTCRADIDLEDILDRLHAPGAACDRPPT